MATITADTFLNRKGKTITTFVVYDVMAAMGQLSEGQVLELLTDDYPAFEPDIEAWCDATGQVLLSTERTEKTKESTLAMILSPDGLEELLSPLGFALAAALEGVRVSIYLQGPATRVLTKGFQPKLKGWSRPFTRFAQSGMTKSGHIPAQEKLRQLRSLGAEIYLCAGSMDHFKVRREDLIFDDLPVVEYLAFMSVMEDADVSLYI
jgi:predicted peroxiredoxin